MEHTELIKKAKTGDKVALTKLLMENRNIVAAVVYRFVFDKEGHKDVIQNVFMKAIEGIKSFHNECRFVTWIYRISVNECCEYNRKKMKSSIFVDEAKLFEDPTALDGLARVSSIEIRSEVSAALKELPLDKRSAFTLFYIGGFNGKDASEALGINEANFFMKLKAARDHVRNHLRKRGFGQ